MTAAHARVRRGDPQSGPPSPQRIQGFFHYNLQWVYAEEGRLLGLSKSRYVNREEEREADRVFAPIEVDPELDIRGESLSDYVNRGGYEMNPELGHHLLITRGLRVRDGAGLARRLDARERKKDRTYRQYGGLMPRVACHAIISFNWGISESDAVSALTEHARLISDTLRVPLEARIHVKHGRPDHAHLLIGTRVVEDGKIGGKQRQLDAVSDKADGRGIVIGGRVLGATLEMLRADWAERMRRASGDQAIDHRSYQRREIAVDPVTHVPRSEIEYQKRRGRADWRHDRDRELRRRGAVGRGEAIDQTMVPPHVGPAEAEHGQGQYAPDVPSHPMLGSKLGRGEEVEHEAVRIRQQETLTPVGGSENFHSASGPSVEIINSRSDVERRALNGDGSGSRAKDRLIHACLWMATELSRQHRLTAERENDIAETMGLHSEDLRAFIGSEVPQSEVARQVEDAQSVLPPDLWATWQQWGREDNAKRRERRVERAQRARLTDDVDVVTPPLRQASSEAVTPVPASAGETGCDRSESNDLGVLSEPTALTHRESPSPRLPSGLGSDATGAGRADERPGAAGAAAKSSSARVQTGQRRPATLPSALQARWGGEPALSARSDGLSRPASPGLDAERSMGAGGRARQPDQEIQEKRPHQSQPPVLAHRAGPGTITGSDALARALYDAQRADAVAHARETRTPLSGVDLQRAIAFRFRASGLSAAEAARAFALCAPPGTAKLHPEWIQEAFSTKAAAQLGRHRTLVDRARAVSAHATEALRRELQRASGERLDRDLNKVWIAHRLRARQAAKRHRWVMAALLGMKSKLRRMRRRGVVAGIASLTIELAIIRPLIREERAVAAENQRTLHEAAKMHAAELKRAQRGAQGQNTAGGAGRAQNGPTGRDHRRDGPGR